VPHTSRRLVGLTLVVAAAVALAAAALMIRAGVYDISATEQHTPPVFRLMETTMRYSVQFRARNIAVPALDATGQSDHGLSCFARHCAGCHGAPGIAGERFALTLQPLPRPLTDAVRQWRAEAGKPFDDKTFVVKSGHGHSLYYNTLAERGTVGFAALAAVLLAWLWRLARRYPGRAGDDRAWALWGGALSGWFVSVSAGVGNTTLHSEHALLSVILLGLWLGDDHRSG